MISKAPLLTERLQTRRDRRKSQHWKIWTFSMMEPRSRLVKRPKVNCWRLWQLTLSSWQRIASWTTVFCWAFTTLSKYESSHNVHQIIVIITQAVEDDRDREARSEDDEEEDEEYDSGGSGVALTPPESPGSDHRPWPWYKISMMMFRNREETAAEEEISCWWNDRSRQRPLCNPQSGWSWYLLPFSCRYLDTLRYDII